MALVCRCDVCKVAFDPDEDGYVKTMKIRLRQLRKDFNCGSEIKTADLCPNCYDTIINWIDNKILVYD